MSPVPWCCSWAAPRAWAPRSPIPWPASYLGPALTSTVSIRAAKPSDIDWLFSMIRELATYERAPEKVTGSTELLARALFGAQPSAEALVAERGGEPAGFALFHGTFSTWEVRPGIWLEDLYVREQHRRAGVGQALLRHVASIAVSRGCARLEWAALHWNEPALRFYEQLEATRLEEWVMHRLDGAALERLAAPEEAASGQRPPAPEDPGASAGRPSAPASAQ